MKHCVLLKLASGADAEKVQHKIWKTCQKLDDELDWLNRPVVCRSCMDAASDFDLMVEVELDGEERLQALADHARILKLEEDLKDDVVRRAVFNHY